MKSLKVAYLLLVIVAVAGCAGPAIETESRDVVGENSSASDLTIPADFTELAQTSDMTFFLQSGGEDIAGAGEMPELEASFAGQSNGLLGAATPGALAFTTGTYLGDVPVHVVVLDQKPELGDWEEIVEASFVPNGLYAALVNFEWSDGQLFELPAESYRVRLSASGMDEAFDSVADESTPALDSYELAFWPAPEALDTIVRQTSDAAKHWHEEGFATTYGTFETPTGSDDEPQLVED